jgi:3-hydroxybutyryl-CoA dehydrogenase
MPIEHVGVVGCGLLGTGIAQVVAQAGGDVVVRELTEELLASGLSRIERDLDLLVAKGALEATERDGVRARLHGTTKLEALADVDLVIEAIVEQPAAKRDLFVVLDRICSPPTIFASNTSSLSIRSLAAATRRADRFLGLHFFNPVPAMKLVEIVRTAAASADVIAEAATFVKRLGKTPVVTGDHSGFIVNRLLVPYLLDAIRSADEGLAGVADIDTAMRLGCGHPMGPLALADLIGLDTLQAIAEAMFEEFRQPRFAPPPLLKRLVAGGRLGRKSGRGFYDYEAKPPQSIPGPSIR